ncbi:MAG: fibronectin type III domain-containing protein [Verrucomicrobia bacterium]|nr:fibronectin type III domain-containing protein [Verrucomicrobiota bacterium]
MKPEPLNTVESIRAAVRQFASVLAAAAAMSAGGTAPADPVVIADARADYQAAATAGQTTANFGGGLGLPDTAGAGHWNYYVLDGITPALMPWNPSHFYGAYNGGGNGWGTVTDQGIWDGVTPGPGELAWHPGSGTPTIIRWSAGASEAGTVQIRGTLVPGAVSFAIKVDDVPLTLTGNSFDFPDVPVSDGSKVDFILTGGGGGASKISAQILQLTTGVRPPPPPTGLAARGINAQVNLSWAASTGASSYSVKRSLTDGGPFTTIAPVVTDTTSADTGLTNGTAYFYVVSATNEVGESANSSQVSATPAPVLAEIRADYQAGTAGQTTANFGGGLGLPDTAGAGHWNYYWQNLADNGLTPLSFAGNPGWPAAYGGQGYPANGGWSNVSDQALWAGSPGADELTWHPGGTKTYDPGGVEGPTVLRWTAAAAEAGAIDITGAVRLGAAAFAIKRDGVELFSSATGGLSFNLTNVSVSDGSNFDFLLYGGPGGASFISGKILCASVPPAQGYVTWANGPFAHPFTDTDPTHDPDGDGMTNFQEFAFGLDPTTGASVNPITVPLDKTSRQFSYTRYAASGLSYTVWTSADLQAWAGPATVTENVGTPDRNGVVTVAVTLTSPPAGATLFVRVQAQ